MYVQSIMNFALIGMLFCQCKSEDVTVFKPAAADVAKLSIYVDTSVYSKRTQMSGYLKFMFEATDKILDILNRLFVIYYNDEFDNNEPGVVSLNSNKSLQDSNSAKRKKRNTFTEIEPVVIKSTNTSAPQVSTESIKIAHNITWIEKFQKMLSSLSTWPDYETIRTKNSNQLQKLSNWAPIVKIKKFSKEIVDYMVHGYATWTPYSSIKKHMNVIMIIGASALWALFCGLLLFAFIYARRSRDYLCEVNRLPDDILLNLV